VSLLCSFLCNRLKEESHSFQGILRILRVIVSQASIPGALVSSIFSRLINDISIQTLEADERSLLFQLIFSLLDKYFDVLKPSDPDSINHTLDEEKDEDLNKLYILIISCISSSSTNEETMSVALQCILYLMEDKSCSKILGNNLSSILPSLLRQCQPDRGLKTRINSLNCISKCSKCLPEKVLLPHKKMVVKQLQTTLDDRKRLVRKSAAEASHEWILLGQPGNAQK